jgi:hypothetical protein
MESFQPREYSKCLVQIRDRIRLRTIYIFLKCRYQRGQEREYLQIVTSLSFDAISKVFEPLQQDCRYIKKEMSRALYLEGRGRRGMTREYNSRH